MKRVAALLVAVACAASLGAQTTSNELESKLPSLTGAERAQVLTTLTDLLKNDQPRKAIEYGTQALAWYRDHPDPINEVKTLNEIAWAFMIVSDYPQAIGSAEKGRDLARQRGDRRGLARALNNLGVIAQRRADGVTAVDLFARSLEIYRQLGSPVDVAAELNNLGFVHSSLLADYDQALAYQLESLTIRESLGDKSAIALSMNNLGIIYDRIGDYDRALESFKKALELRKNSGAQNRIAATLTNLGDVYLAKGDYENAVASLEESLMLRQRVGDEEGAAFSLARLGRVYAEMGRNDLATPNLQDALRIAERTGDKNTIANCLIGLSDVNRAQGHAAVAVAHAQSALQVAGETTGRELRRRALESLARSQEAARDFAGALASYKEFTKENDRIFDEDKTKRLETLERRYQAEKREAEIQRLKSEEALRENVASRQRFQRNLAIGGGLLFAVVGFGVYRRRALSAALAEQLSVTDALTGLKNRHFVLQTIATDIAAADRRGMTGGTAPRPTDADIVFLIIDIDGFKSVNDQYGHRAGDAMLTQVAHVLRNVSRSSDTIARWGGEEFLLISKFSDRRSASILAERLRREFEQNVFEIGDGRTLKRTCSIGYACYPFSIAHPDVLTWEQIVAIADEAMYMAKRGGANAWVGAAAAPEASEEQLRQLQRRTADNLAQLVAAGAVQTETAVLTSTR